MPRLIASWFGSGLLLRAMRGSDTGAGTIGAALALLMSIGFGVMGWWVQALAAVTVSAVSVWASGHFADEGDPAWVVVDEAAGMFLATIGLLGWSAAVAFVVFRIADIFKQTPGVGVAERLRGGWGITADDLVAGLYGLAAGWAFRVLT